MDRYYFSFAGEGVEVDCKSFDFIFISSTR